MKRLKEYNELRTFLQNHFRHILECANLTHYHVDAIKPMVKPVGPNVTFQITTDITYLRIFLEFDDKEVRRYWRNGMQDRLISDLCHEATHVLINEFTDAITPKESKAFVVAREERVVEHASRWLLKNYQEYMFNNLISKDTGLKEHE